VSIQSEIFGQRSSSAIVDSSTDANRTWSAEKLLRLLGNDPLALKMRPIAMRADPTHFNAYTGVIVDAGTLEIGDIVHTDAGVQFQINALDLDDQNAIVRLNPSALYSIDPAGVHPVQNEAGTHSGQIDVITHYAPGNNQVLGWIEFVNASDPFVSKTELSAEVGESVTLAEDPHTWSIGEQQLYPSWAPQVYGIRNSGNISGGSGNIISTLLGELSGTYTIARLYSVSGWWQDGASANQYKIGETRVDGTGTVIAASWVFIQGNQVFLNTWTNTERDGTTDCGYEVFVTYRKE